MRAATFDQYGTPEVLHVEEVSAPTHGPTEILVRVYASPVTQGDRTLRAADYPGIAWLPGRMVSGMLRPRHRIGGSNFAGEVVAVGREVTRFKVGDRVFGATMHSAQAEYLAVAQDSPVAVMPPEMGYPQAATLPYGAATALIFLRDVARLQPGQRALIIGATGGVGRFAVQLACHLGAHVTAVGSDPALALRLGAHRAIDHRAEDFAADGQRYDVIFDTSSSASFPAVRSSLTPTGRFLSVTMSLPLILQMIVTSIFKRQRAFFTLALANQAVLEDVSALAAQGAIAPVIDSLHPLSMVRRAHHHLEAARPHGSVVLTLAP